MQKDKLKYILGISFICFLVLFALFSIGFLDNVNVKLTDNLYGGLNPADNIAIIAIDDKSIQELGRWPWNRTVFADLMPRLEASSVIGIDVAFFEPTEDDSIIADAFRNAGNVIIPVEYTSFYAEDGEIYGKEILMPAKDILGSADLAYVNIATDKDGVTRAINMDVKGDYDNFAYVIYNKYWKKEISREKRFLVNFAGKPGSFAIYSFSDVLKNNYDFENKIVLIGATSPDLHDDYFVPTSEGKAMPGVEVHANAVQTMLTGKFLQKSSLLMTAIIILAFCFATALLLYRFKMWVSAIICIALFIAYVFIAIKMFSSGTIMNIVYAPFSIILTFIAETAYLYSAEKKHKKQITEAFGKYVSPVVVEEIAKHPEKLKLGGEKKEISIFFSDIRGFTTISEKMAPEELSHFLNRYLTEMADIVMDNKGFVDKYIGDAVMAFWGAPLDEPNHAEFSCVSALKMREKLKQLNKAWEKENLPEIRIGMGINTGEAVIGNLGSLHRFNYTAIGDNVNLASRLEGLTKQYGVSIIISESTYNKVKEKFICRQLDMVAVKGKTKPIRIYELICSKENITDETKQLVSGFESALNDYFSKDWSFAEKKFRIIDDAPSKLFIERIKEFKANPPPEDWNRVFVMKSK